MKIVISTRFLLTHRLEGQGVFTYQTLKRITQQHPEHEFVFIFDRPYEPIFLFSPNIVPEVAFPPNRHPVLWYIWFEWSVRRLLRRHKPDLFISMDGCMPLHPRVPTLAVIHDIAFEHYPKDVRLMHGAYYRRYYHRYAAIADRIATVSEHSRQDIIETYKIDASKIDVVYNGVSEIFQPATDEERRRTRAELTGGRPYFVYVGALHQRKNVLNLLHAYELFRTQNDHDVALVIVGRKAWGNRRMLRAYADMRFRDDVIFTGVLPDTDLVRVFGSALALSFVSYAEGFGIPIIEAMACGVPVIAGNQTAVPETAGDAAITVDPFSIEDIAEAMNQIATDPNLCQDLAERGLKRAAEFSWDRTARLLWESVEKVMRKKG